MLDLDKLEAEREAAAVDKADLFDFYHKHWAALLAAATASANPCAKIFDHKWLDPKCVENGCQSLCLKARSSLIIKAAQYAYHAHHGQTRKYTGRPFVEHPMRVAGEVSMLDLATEEMVAAAWLHDVIEDCGAENKNAMKFLFPPSVVSMVVELTNPSKDHPELRRADRKAMDRAHLAAASREAKIIKLVDRIDNLRDMSRAEPDFLVLYSRESRQLADALRSDDAMIRLLTNRIYRVTAPYMKGAA